MTTGSRSLYFVESSECSRVDEQIEDRLVIDDCYWYRSKSQSLLAKGPIVSLLEKMSESDFFRSTPLVTLRLLEPIACERDFAPGVQIFAEGQKHPEIHVVFQGHVRLEMLVPGRGRTPIMSAGTGDLLGWSPLLSESEMTATAVALDSVKTLAFPAEKLRQLCEANHEIGFHVMKRLANAIAHRLMATRLQLLDLYKEHAPATKVELTSIKPGDDEC